MIERLTESEIATAKQGSRWMEEAWRVVSKPRDHSSDEVEEAREYIKGQKKNISLSIESNIGRVDPTVFNEIFLGIYHRGIHLPPELKFKPTNRN